MRIRHKLSFSFSVIGTIILLLFSLAIYFFSSNHTQKEFYNQLSRRVNIAEKMILERNNFSQEDFEKIKEQFLHTLPREEDKVIPVVGSVVPADAQKEYPESFIQKILVSGIAYFEEGDMQGVGKYFRLDGGNYIVVVTAVDVLGMEKLTYLRGIIIAGLLISILLFALLGIPVSSRIIKPLLYKIRMANMISANNLHQRLTGITSKDEIGELATAFNSLLDRIESAFEAKKAFISNASHEIRNPLTAIINETDISLAKDRTVQEYKDSLQSVSNEAERMKLLVDNLLELSKISYADIPFQFEYIQLIPAIGKVIEKYRFSNKECNIIFQPSPEISELNPGVWGNNNLITSALLNIIDNACKFSSNEGVTIQLLMEDQNAIISIQDKGMGIPADDIPMIKEPFFRSQNARQTSGSGIGVALAHKIVQIHRGKLEFDSQLNEGTEVTIILPIEEKLNS